MSVIATAAHVLDKYAGASVLTLGVGRAVLLSGERRGFGHRPGETADVDLALIVLHPDEREEVSKRFTFSYGLELAPTGRMDAITYFSLVGYPHSRNKLSPRLRRGEALPSYFISRAQKPLEDVSSSDKFAHVHFAIGASTDGAVDVNGAPAPFPAPSGMSGGGVWRLFFPPSDELLPSARLTGIIIEYFRRPGAFVCTRVEHLLPLLADLA